MTSTVITFGVAVSLSIATAAASPPIKYQPYLPESWAEDAQRRKDAGVPEEVRFATKPEISLAQMKAAKAAGLPGDIALADAGYGDDTRYRDGITGLGMRYAVGIKTGTKVCAPGSTALPPKPWSGKGRKPTRLRRGPDNQPVTVKNLALSLPASAWRKTTWRRAPTRPCPRALPPCAYVPPMATARHRCGATKNGCSSSGPRANRNRSSISCPPCPPRPRARNW